MAQKVTKAGINAQMAEYDISLKTDITALSG